MSDFGILMVVLSAALGVVIAVLATVYSKKKAKRAEGFFTADRNVGTALMIASFIAYAVGTGLLFSPGEEAWYDGFTAMIGYALAISVAYVVFVPISKKIRNLIPEGHTIGEYTKARYGPVMYIVTIATTIIYMFILFASNMTGAVLAFHYLGGVPLWLSALVIGIPTIYFATRGGVSAAIFGNGLQSVLITPFLIIPAVFVLVHYNGPGTVYQGVLAQSASHLQILNPNGLKFAIMIIIAVTCAELLNQTLWQRVYAGKSDKVVSRSLLAAAVMVFPMTIIAAFLGLTAVASGIIVPHSSVVAALVVNDTAPKWVCMIFVLVIMLGASSTGGDALSGFSSIFSLDIVKTVSPTMKPETSIRVARIGSILMGVAGLVVAYFQPSILFLLLLADLLASATAVPVVVGLYLKKANGTWAAIGTTAGIVAGLPMFIAGNSLWSFLTALLVSSGIVIISSLFCKKEYDFSRLSTEIKKM